MNWQNLSKQAELPLNVHSVTDLAPLQRTWPRLDAHDLLPLVRAGVGFTDGLQVESAEQSLERKAGKVAA